MQVENRNVASPVGQHAYKSPARQYRVKPATLYAGATNYVATTVYRLAKVSSRDWERGYHELETAAADRTTVGYIAGPTPSFPY